MFLSSLTLCDTYFSHDRFHLSSPFFSSTKSQIFPCISDITCEVSKFQHHTKLCSKCSTSISVHFSVAKRLLVVCCLCHGWPGFNFTSAS